MERIYLEELTYEKVTYRYHPEGGKEYGVVSLLRKTGERIHEKPCINALSMYAGQAWKRLEKYQKTNFFPKEDLIAWY